MGFCNFGRHLMGLFKSLIGCFSETAHFEDVAHAAWFFYYNFKDRFPELNEEQLRCMALLYCAFYDQKHHLGVYHVKYCIAHWVCGDSHIPEIDELVLTFSEGICNNRFLENAKGALDGDSYMIKKGKVISEKQKALKDVQFGGGGVLRASCRNVTLDRLGSLCAELGHILQRGTVFM